MPVSDGSDLWSWLKRILSVSSSADTPLFAGFNKFVIRHYTRNVTFWLFGWRLWGFIFQLFGNRNFKVLFRHKKLRFDLYCFNIRWNSKSFLLGKIMMFLIHVFDPVSCLPPGFLWTEVAS